jgi:CHAT domain/WD domain, G-beta repeat
MEAVDVELEISSGSAGTYLVAARSPSGEAMATMRLPFDEEEIDNRLRALQTTLIWSTARTRRVISEVEQPVVQFGAALFDALIAGDVRVLVGASRDRAAHEGKRLRLVLRIRPPELSRLPWEFLYNTGADEYLALTMPLLRYPEVLEPRRPLEVSPPLEILGMVARPSDRDPLEIEEEQQWLRAALVDLERAGRVRLTWIEGQTWRDLQRAMRQGRWHVFHFIGHGGFDHTAGEGIIALTDDQGSTRLLHAGDLSLLLRDHASLRLVLLNACDTGRADALDPFSSTAGALVRRGIPAVVAMQYEVSDRAAIEFARTFYAAIADELPIDVSVMEARRAVKLAHRSSLEWGTPVLYLRSTHARIFHLSTSPATPMPRHAAGAPQDPVALLEDTKPVVAVAFSPDGAMLATGSSDWIGWTGQVRLWSVSSGRELRRLSPGWISGVSGLTFSPNGARLAAGGTDGVVCVWHVRTGNRLARVGRRSWVNNTDAVAFSPDGNRLATAGNDKSARVWDASSGRQLLKITHDNSVHSIAFSPDGNRLATAGNDKAARVWDATSGQQLLKLAHDATVQAIAFSRDGCRLATAGNEKAARVWDAASGQQLLKIPHDSIIHALAFSPDGCRLATAGNDKTARVWDAASGQQLLKIPHDSIIHALAFSPDGSRLATGSRDRRARIWMLEEAHE